MKKLLILGFLFVLVGSLFASGMPEVKGTNEVVVCELTVEAIQIQSIDLNVVMTFENIVEADVAKLLYSELKENALQEVQAVEERFVLFEPIQNKLTLYKNKQASRTKFDFKNKDLLCLQLLKLLYNTGSTPNFNYLC